MRDGRAPVHLGAVMLWTASLCLFVVWLLALLLDRGAPWVHALPLVVAGLLAWRLARTALGR